MRKGTTISLILLTFIFMVGCKQTDVIAQSATKSFDKMLGEVEKTTAEGKTTILAENGQIFEYGKDGTRILLPIKPFIDAGLDISKLPATITVEEEYMIIEEDYQAEEFSDIVEKYRDNIAYHESLDHYLIKMGDHTAFEWAKDMDTNDKDIVFVLKPEFLEDAGVDVANIEGYAYAEVEQMDKSKEYRVLAFYEIN